MSRVILLAAALVLGSALTPAPALAQAATLCGRSAEYPSQLMVDLMRVANGRPQAEDAEFVTLSDPERGAVFTFTKRGHPAHPAVVCRRPQQVANGFAIQTEARCGSDKATCDALVARFNATR